MSDDTVLEARNVSFSYGKHDVLRDVSLSFEKGKIYGLLGPNGSGKSTLLRLLTGALKPDSGTINLQGRSLQILRKREIARILSFVPQDFAVDFPFTCYEVVMMGRYMYQGVMGLGRGEDDAIVRRCLSFTKTESLEKRPVTQLSGGELQRIMIAQALAQEGEILLLDEPTSHLDIKFQIEICELLKSLNEEKGVTVISSFHDLNLAACYCHYLYFTAGGHIQERGPVETAFTEEIINRVFGIQAKVVPHPFTGRPLIVYHSDSRQLLSQRHPSGGD